ncbi:hypothetical protein TRVL_03811 [Trypanosoma vivax]|nr:hypothetical protein TRVL_03811 [Trypanosoma vivax]
MSRPFALSPHPVNVPHHPTKSFNPAEAGAMATTFEQKSTKASQGCPRSHFEQSYRDSLAQLALLQQKLRQHTLATIDLERSALEYYYSNVICFDGYDGEQMAQQNSSSHHYYFRSSISQARRLRYEKRTREECQQRQERARIERLEEETHASVICGVLATEQEAVQAAEEENNALRKQLVQGETERLRCERELNELRKRQQDAENKRAKILANIRRIEEGKKKQMEDVDGTRLLLSIKREELEVAQAELRRREMIVEDLRNAIALLTRGKK